MIKGYLTLREGAHQGKLPSYHVWSYGNEDINSHINSYMNNLEEAESPPRSARWSDFQNQEYRFTIPKSPTRLARKQRQQEDEKHRQLQRSPIEHISKRKHPSECFCSLMASELLHHALHISALKPVNHFSKKASP